MSSAAERTHAEGDPWEDCTFEGAALATVRNSAKLTFAEKIDWLEDVHRMALRFQETRRKQGLRTIYPDGRIEN